MAFSRARPISLFSASPSLSRFARSPACSTLPASSLLFPSFSLSSLSLSPSPSSRTFLSPSSVGRSVHTLTLKRTAAPRPPFTRFFSNSTSSASSPSSSVPPPSSTSSSSSSSFSSSSLSSTLSDLKSKGKTYLLIGCVVVGVIIVINAGLYVIQFFSTISFLDVGEYSFLAGMLTAFGLLGVASLANRSWSIRPDSVFQDCMRLIGRDSRLLSIIGSDFQSGSFRAYSFLPGHIRWRGREREAAKRTIQLHSLSAGTPILPNSFSYYYLKFYQPRRLQMFFQLNSRDNRIHVMCSAEVEKGFSGQIIYNLLAVDFLESGDRLVLAGDQDYKIYQGVVRLR